jgi:hypothetical protein
MQTRDTDICNANHRVAHDLCGYGGFLSHRHIAGSGTNDCNRPLAFGQRLFLDCHATREFMVNRALEFLPQRLHMIRREPRNEDVLFPLD